MNKYEQLIEHIINDEEGQARALFHEIVVEKSRDIYESLMDEEYAEEDVGGSQVEAMMDEITMDETDGIGEGQDEEMDMDDEMTMGMDDGDDHHADVGGEEELEQKVMDLESELEALKAEFEALMGDDADMNDMDDEADMDDMGDEMSPMGDEDQEDVAMMETEHDDEDEDEDDDKEEKMTESRRPLQKTAVDLMREYVEKISAPSNTEFTPVGTGAGGDKAAGNTANPVAGKNDMGGTSANIAKGGNEQAPDGTSPKGKADGHLVKNVQEIDVAKRNVNKPGGNKGAQDFYNTKAKAKAGEGQTTNGSVPVQKRSIEPGGN
jgi:hypothetical protein